MIGIIDYGCSNINAVKNILDSLHIKNQILVDGKNTGKIDKYILPGVSSYDSSMKNIKKFNDWNNIFEDILINKKYLLGICVGMQLLGNKSEEGSELGLSLIDDEVLKLNQDFKLPIPHMGWNNIYINKDSKLLKGITEKSYFYFCHSYCFQNLESKNVIAYTNYGEKFCSIVNNENIYGVQFHPEKSHKNGEKIFSNFEAL